MGSNAKAPPSIGPDQFGRRIDAARSLLRARGADALIVNAGDSLRYFCGVPWSATERLVALAIPVSGEPWILCPRFETGSLADCLRLPLPVLTWEEDEPPAAIMLTSLEAGQRVVLDPDMSLRFASILRATRPDLVFLDDVPVIDTLRTAKEPAEIALIRYAMGLTLAAHEAVFAFLRPGTRASEVRRFADQAHRDLGARDGTTFCAVQFGHATAFPHGIQEDQILGENDLVLVDMGCRIDGYHADITRTYAFGTPEPEQARIWAIEKEAQLAAFAAARPGAPCRAVDDAARAVLVRHGLGPAYRLPGLPHRTGHGVGLSVHETPYLVRGNETPLRPGHCASIEPMIVVPDRFGIRLEDHFHVTEEGPRWFTEPAASFERPFG
jgi:Xaa-Pro dipeptidase